MEESMTSRRLVKQQFEFHLMVMINLTRQNLLATQQLVEAIALQDLLSSVIQTDMNGDHFIGDSELNMLAFRLQQIEGVPFTGEELCTRFAKWPTRNLRSLVDCVRTLYIEKRREQVAAKEAQQSERLPRQLGAHLLWNDKMSYGVKIAHGVKA
jgi:hypothetical protein